MPEPLIAQVIRKSTLTFAASDGLLVTADLYQSKKSNPYILLFHEDQSCKAEYDSIVSRFIKMNYNCMAVDLRSGSDVGFNKNETANRAKEEGFSTSIFNGILDMEAAINYAYDLSGKDVSLIGSGSSASLALIVGARHDKVTAVVNFSPGEYLLPDCSINNLLADFIKPVFVACTATEKEYLSGIEGFPGIDKVLFSPTDGEGLHGTSALLPENQSRDEYWLSLLIFFKSLQ